MVFLGACGLGTGQPKVKVESQAIYRLHLPANSSINTRIPRRHTQCPKQGPECEGIYVASSLHRGKIGCLALRIKNKLVRPHLMLSLPLEFPTEQMTDPFYV